MNKNKAIAILLIINTILMVILIINFNNFEKRYWKERAKLIKQYSNQILIRTNPIFLLFRTNFFTPLEIKSLMGLTLYRRGTLSLWHPGIFLIGTQDNPSRYVG